MYPKESKSKRVRYSGRTDTLRERYVNERETENFGEKDIHPSLEDRHCDGCR